MLMMKLNYKRLKYISITKSDGRKLSCQNKLVLSGTELNRKRIEVIVTNL